MTIQFDEKPTPEQILHYGVAGMKWGQRKKATGPQIRQARKRLGSAQKELFKKQDQVKATGKGEKELAKMTTDFLKSPDRVTAIRLTRGEKILSLALGGPVGVAAIAVTSAASRHTEKKQDEGAYDKKK
jgi:hypothetical protein